MTPQPPEEVSAFAADLPRVVMLESEYMLATAPAQLSWVRSVIADLRAGRLAWSQDELRELADRSATENSG